RWNASPAVPPIQRSLSRNEVESPAGMPAQPFRQYNEASAEMLVLFCIWNLIGYSHCKLGILDNSLQ
ncbi:hypothetical protein, partial [Photobacterium leiognathi]|uniref:hypothetical protein n=1 Tax=Photobacterium leiognathi TaxID=553611 RepID=UPI001E49AA0D